MKRITAFLLALAIGLSVLPFGARAAETAVSQQALTVAPDPGLPDSDELFAAYTDQVLYGTQISAFGFSAGSRLRGDVKVLYDAMVPVIRQIAEGKRSSTCISVGRTVKFAGKTFVPDVEAVFTGSDLTAGDLNKLVTALMSDLPCEMYWYDKTDGCATEMLCGSTLLYVKLKFSVVDNYRSGTYSVDTAKSASVSLAAANARRIVSCYESASDYNKLMGYSDAVCDLAGYNKSAASRGSFSKDNDPWQLIYVFDGDPDTKVVCEGYAKAFLYLCDLSQFRGDTACYTVTGTLDGAAHMWNIVTLEGKNYLADVTNSDDRGYGTDLMLAGCSGSVTGSYQVSGLSYRYDSTTKAFWGTGSGSILKLTKSAYTPDDNQDHAHSYGSWTRFTAATASCIGIKSRTCDKCGYLDTHCSGTVEPEAPTVKISANSVTGKPRLTWGPSDGADAYRVYRATGKSGSYSRVKSTGSTSYTDSTAKAGKIYYYKVIAVDTDSGKTSGRSNIVSQTCDLPKPTATLSVKTSSGKPVVKWETVEGASMYYIYRATGNGSFRHIKTAVSARSFEDTSAKAGVSYSYRVKAVHKNTSANSAYSASVSRVCDLAKPVVSIKLSNGDPRLTWEKISGAEKYYVYRAISKNGSYTKVKTTKTSTSFTDTTAKAGTTYYYKVIAIHAKSSANSAYSSVKHIKAK